MISFKDNMVNLFVELSHDEKLLTLIEVPNHSDMRLIKEQIVEDRYSNNSIGNNLSRLCLYETVSHPTTNPNIEKCYIEIDIYVTKDKNKIDRRILLIAQRLVELVDTAERKKRGKPPILTGVDLSYSHKLPNMYTDSPDWAKYGVVFSYGNIKL